MGLSSVPWIQLGPLLIFYQWVCREGDDILADSQIDQMSKVVTLRHPPSEPISSFENGHFAAMLQEDVSASQAGESGPYNTDTDLPCPGSRSSEHILRSGSLSFWMRTISLDT